MLSQVEASGDTLVLLDGDFVCDCIKAHGAWAPTEQRLFRQVLRPGDSVIEVGAHVGAHAVPMSKLIGDGTWYCFEPQQEVFKVLCANLALNGCSNVVPYPYGLALHSRHFFYTPPQTPNSGGFQILRDTRYPGRTLLKTRPLSYFAELEGVQRLRLVKIDVEGMEEEVLAMLAPLVLKHRPIILVEYMETTFVAVVRLLGGMGYDAYYYNTSMAQYGQAEGLLADQNLVACPKDTRVEGLVRVGAEATPRYDIIVV